MNVKRLILLGQLKEAIQSNTPNMVNRCRGLIQSLIDLETEQPDKEEEKKVLLWQENKWLEKVDAKKLISHAVITAKDGQQVLIEADCSGIINSIYGGDVEAFKEALRGFKVDRRDKDVK
jgi:hypothetical protein